MAALTATVHMQAATIMARRLRELAGGGGTGGGNFLQFDDSKRVGSIQDATPANIESLVAAAAPGTWFRLGSGTYNSLVLQPAGTIDNPIVLFSNTQRTFNGTTEIRGSGHMEIWNTKFEQSGGANSRACEIYSTNITLAYPVFESGGIGLELRSTSAKRMRCHRGLFMPVTSTGGANGTEYIKFGVSGSEPDFGGTGGVDLDFEVDWCLFQNSGDNQEREMVSFKCVGGLLRDSTFEGTKDVSFRRCSDVTVRRVLLTDNNAEFSVNGWRHVIEDVSGDVDLNAGQNSGTYIPATQCRVQNVTSGNLGVGTKTFSSGTFDLDAVDNDYGGISGTVNIDSARSSGSTDIGALSPSTGIAPTLVEADVGSLAYITQVTNKPS